MKALLFRIDGSEREFEVLDPPPPYYVEVAQEPPRDFAWDRLLARLEERLFRREEVGLLHGRRHMAYYYEQRRGGR